MQSLPIDERLHTSRLFVERFSEKDLDFFLDLSSDWSVNKYFSFEGDPKRYFKEEILAYSSSNTILYLVICKNDGTPIGMLNLFYYANGLWVAEYALLEAFRNQGYMSELLTELFTNVELFFEIFGITEKFMCLEFVIDNDNIFSRKLVDSVSKSLKLSKTQQGSSIYIDIL